MHNCPDCLKKQLFPGFLQHGFTRFLRITMSAIRRRNYETKLRLPITVPQLQSGAADYGMAFCQLDYPDAKFIKSVLVPDFVPNLRKLPVPVLKQRFQKRLIVFSRLYFI